MDPQDAAVEALDQTVHKALSALEAQAPAGYFDSLAARTIARLDEPLEELTMASDADAGKQGTTGNAGTATSGGAPRDEDSGLHDLRSLATRTRSRMTSQRLAVLDSEAEISTSAQALRAVALPEPAKMVALPAPPTAAPLGEAVAAAARAAEVKNAKPARARGTTNEPALATSSAPAVAQSSSGTGKYVIGGVVAIAAAAAVVFAVTRSSKKPAQVIAPVVAVATVPAPAPVAVVAPPPQVAVAVAPEVTPPAAVETAPAPVEAPAKKAEPAIAKSDAPAKDKPSKAADAPKADKAVAAKTGGKGDGESLDDLLGAAGDKAGAQKAADAPKPEKKSLTSGDIKSAMGPLSKRAQACQGSTGATGSVAIKVVVSSNGKVKSAEATGSFAGSPAGECVAKVARQASFPAWDGAPTITVDYAYFLAE